VTPTSIAQQVLQVPLDLPSVVTAIAAGEDFLWLGTRAGLVRVRIARR
jgi:hypothetical protein